MEEKQNKEMTMDEAYKALQEVLEQMENGDLELEQKFTLYQKGLALVKLCSDKLDDVEKKMIILENNTEENEDA